MSFPQASFVHARFTSSIPIISDMSTRHIENVRAIVGEHGKIYEIGRLIEKCHFGCLVFVNELQFVEHHWTRSGRIYAAKLINLAEYLNHVNDHPENPLSEIACYQYIATLGGHPHIMGLVDALLLSDWYVSIMEYAPGGSILSKVELDGVVAPERMPRYVSMLCSALSFLHEHNICHRDLSAENIVYFPQSDTIKIVDFGMAFMFPDVGLYTPPPVVFGKKPYLAPEILRRVDFYPPPVDMWAVGVICFVCLVHRWPQHKCMMQGLRFTDAVLLESMQLLLQECNITLPQEALSLIQDLLREVPEERLTAQQVLKHAWVENALV